MKNESGVADQDRLLIDRVLHALACGAAALSSDLHLISANEALGRLLQQPRNELQDKPLAEAIGSAAAEQLGRVEPCPETGELACPMEIRLADGSARQVLANLRHFAPDGHAGAASDGTARRAGLGVTDNAPAYILTIFDVTEQREHERRLQSQYKEMSRLGDVLIQQALALKRHTGDLEARVRERTQELHEANLAAIYMLAVASEARDEETGAHIRRIESYSRTLARALELPAAEVEQIGYSAILHDVGKVLIPDNILLKPGPLTDNERATMQTHTLVGENILSTKPFFELARQIARHHHERWDGDGYPDRLSQEAIPLAARIVHIVDVYDALRSERVYKPPWPPERVRQALLDDAGKSFDPRLVRVFDGILARGEI